MSNAFPPEDANSPCIPGLELQEKLGEGGMGVVYRAVHRNLQRTVAVKVLRALNGDAATGAAWLRESRLMASLAHPHVVAIHDAGQVQGLNYLVLEFMAGGSLRSRMEPGRPWPLEQAIPLLNRIAQALNHIHAQGVLHLDLKPENVLDTSDGQCKITDFGLSVPHADASALLEGRSYRGTLDYSAPEQRCGLALDVRCDVFSLATLAYELLTGRLPGRVYVPASRRNPRLPTALDEVLRRGLARNPQDRYPSVAAFEQALAVAARPPRGQFRTRLLVAGVALTALVVALLAGFGQRPTPTTTPPPADRPTRVWVLYDDPNDLSLFAGEEGRDLASGSDVPVERVQVEKPPQGIAPELFVPVWPTPRPVLVVQSPGAWGFIHPLIDQTLGDRVVKNWQALRRTVVPPEMNFVKAGGFSGKCLTTDHRGNLNLWRAATVEEEQDSRKMRVTGPDEQPDNPALLITNLDPRRSKDHLGCYQPLRAGPPKGSVVVLRYRARADSGAPHLQVYLQQTVEIPPEDRGVAATRVRARDSVASAKPANPPPSRCTYRIPAWVAPTTQWQSYYVIFDLPPFPSEVTHRKVVIDTIDTGRVWIDDIELFVWQPGNDL